MTWPLIEDSAESLGGYFGDKHTGTFGKAGVFSFNGNKIITTSGGGMLVSNDGDLIAHARKLATQARDNAPHYQHSEIGYNYRMSNLLAAVGRGQLGVIEERVVSRRQNYEYYLETLTTLPGISIIPDAGYGRSNHWLSVITLDTQQCGTTREAVRLALESQNIEARPVWKPMHLQPIFKDCVVYDGSVSEALFNDGLCLPSGSNLDSADKERIVSVIRECCTA